MPDIEEIIPEELEPTENAAPPPPKKGGRKKTPEPVPPRPVVYPELIVNGIVVPEKNLRVTVAQAKAFMDWETEPEYAARVLAETGVQGATIPVRDRLLRNLAGEWVACWNNSNTAQRVHNRPFSEGDAKVYAQDILNKKWRLNGEAGIVGKTARILSWQHRLAGLVLAGEMWKAQPHWQHIWPEEPYILSIVICGIDEDVGTVQTFDGGVPRTGTDVAFSTGVYDDLTVSNRPAAPVELKEICRYHSAAIILLWKRTGASGINQWEKYQTHAASMEWFERHPRLKKAVKHIFEENRDRSISKLHLSAGECAGLMYLMAASTSDMDRYRNGDPPRETLLEFTHWDRASEFFSLLGKGPDLKPVQDALAKLENDDTGHRKTKKFSILSKAWKIFLAGGKITAKDLAYTMQENPDTGKTFMAPEDLSYFGGIDQGDDGKGEPEAGAEELTEEQVEANKVAVRAEKAQKLKDRVDAKKGAGPKSGDNPTLAPGETKPDPIVHDADGKPEPPKVLATPQHKAPAKGKGGNGKPLAGKPGAAATRGPSQKQINAAQTARAKAADEAAKADK